MQTPEDNPNIGLGGHYGWDAGPDSSMAPPVKNQEVVSPSHLIAIGDGFEGGSGKVLDGTSLLSQTSRVQDYLGSTQRAFKRHNGKANIAFCDGHVDSRLLRYLFVDKSDTALSQWNRDNQPHRERLP
jgi:prepilin-type processing-associated H-X9-DG protein